MCDHLMIDRRECLEIGTDDLPRRSDSERSRDRAEWQEIEMASSVTSVLGTVIVDAVERW
jgi:hypothetical protein